MDATFAFQLALPLAELATLLWLRRKIATHRYSALLWYLGTECAWHTLTLFDYRIATRIGAVPRMAMRAWLVLEVFRFACLRFHLARRLRLAGEAVAISAAAAWLTLLSARTTPLASAFTFRAYYHLLLAGSLWWLVVRLHYSPVAENRDHRAYRWAMTRWLTIVALCGVCIRGIVGQWISSWHGPAAQWVWNSWHYVIPSPDSVATWVWFWANLGGYALLTINCTWMAHSMTANISCLRPDVAYGPNWPAAMMLPKD